jgi:hypothetical protein
MLFNFWEIDGSEYERCAGVGLEVWVLVTAKKEMEV